MDYYQQQFNTLLIQLLYLSEAYTDNMLDVLRKVKKNTNQVLIDTIRKANPEFKEFTGKFEPYIAKLKYQTKLESLIEIIIKEAYYKYFLEWSYIEYNNLHNITDFDGINILKVITNFALFIRNWWDELQSMYENYFNKDKESHIAYFKLINSCLGDILYKS